MALWAQAGLLSVRGLTQAQSAQTTVYVDDRTIVAREARVLSLQEQSWAQWSASVGLLEHPATTEATAITADLTRSLAETFRPDAVRKHVKLLGACSYFGPRAHTEAEAKRLQSAERRLKFLGCVGFGLARFLREAETFAPSKANFGWISGAPTLGACKKLWTCMWRASGRIHYSNPWTRALLWTNCHLDVQWAVRLVGAVLKRASKEPVLWTLMRGTAPAALNAWLIAPCWLLAGPWRWSHPFAGLRLELSAGRGPMTPKALRDRIGRQQHCLRQGWRAWAATQWVACDRHELRTFDLWQAGGQGLRNLNWPDTQALANSRAAAATVTSGACFSPATWHVASADCRDGPRDHLCIWGCRALGTLDHLRGRVLTDRVSSLNLGIRLRLVSGGELMGGRRISAGSERSVSGSLLSNCRFGKGDLGEGLVLPGVLGR